MNYCPHCGSKISDPSSKFCGNCGKSIIVAPPVLKEIPVPHVPQKENKVTPVTKIQSRKEIVVFAIIMIVLVLMLVVNNKNSQSASSSNSSWPDTEYNKTKLIGGYVREVGVVFEVSLQSVEQKSNEEIEILLHAKCKILRHFEMGSVGTFLQIKATLTDRAGSIATETGFIHPKLNETVEVKIKVRSVSEISISDLQSIRFTLQNFNEPLSPFSSGNGEVLPEILLSK